MFEHRSPGCDADAGADEHGDFVVEDILGWCAIGAIDAKLRHLLAVLEGDFVDAVFVEGVEFFGLCGSAAEGVAE